MNIGGLEIDPIEFASQGNAVLGIRDSGKTYTATCIAEQLFEAGIPFFAFDPIGVWRYLRVPGQGRGYPVVVVGGKSPDLPLTVDNAVDLVRAAMDAGVSMVFDLFDLNLSKTDWRKIVTAAVRTMLHENRALRHVFIEEAAEFIPQRPTDFITYAEIEKLARMGRNSRLGYTLINQRSQEVSKAILELCENVFLHRQRGSHAIDSLDKWLHRAAAAERREIIKSLPDLPRGECWAWLGGDTPQPPRRIKVPAKNSLHPDARTLERATTAPLASPVDVAEFVEGMRRRLPSQRAQIASARRAVKEDQTSEDEARSAAYREGFDAGHAKGLFDGEQRAFQRLVENLRRIENTVGDQVRAILNGWSAGNIHASPAASEPIKAPAAPVLAAEKAVPVSRAAQTVPHSGGSTAALRMLKVLADRHPAQFTRAQWATLAVLAKSGGTFSGYLGALRKAGYLDEADGKFGVSPAGMAACGSIAGAPQSPAEVAAMWKKALGGGPARMIDVLIAAGKAGTDRANLADRLNIAVSGGTFGAYLGALRSNGLIEVKGRKVTLTSTLRGE